MVGEIGIPGLVEQDVAVAHVAVHDPHSVTGRQRSANHVDEVRCALEGPRPVGSSRLAQVVIQEPVDEEGAT